MRGECEGDETISERERERKRERERAIKNEIKQLYLMLQYSVLIPCTVTLGIILSNYRRPDGSMFFEIFRYIVIYFC